MALDQDWAIGLAFVYQVDICNVLLGPPHLKELIQKFL